MSATPTSDGSRIAKARRDLGFSQKQLASRVGISLWTLDEIERGHPTGAQYLPPILRALDLPTDGEKPQVDRQPRDATSPSTVAASSLVRAAGRNLILGSFAVLVLIRFFTEVVPVVPRAANFIDVPIFIVLGLAGLVRGQEMPGVGRKRLLVPVGLFLALSVLSTLLNSSRTEIAPVLVFLYGFLAPLAVYAAAYRLWPHGNALALSRLLVSLGVTQLVVIFTIDLRRFVASGHNPDVISGTFGTNAYQLVFFLLVVLGLLAGIFTVEPQRRAARLAPVLIVFILGAIFLAQYRALLATTAVTVLLIACLIGSRARGIVAAVITGLALVITLQYVATRFPNLKFASTVSTLTQSPGFYAKKRLGSARSVVSLFTDDPRFIVTGTGPGTFSSRAWQTFASSQSTSSSNVQGAYATALTGGAAYHTDVSDKYVLPQLQGASAVQGSDALSSPYSSYLSVMAELGLFGFIVITGVYLGAIARALRASSESLRQRETGDPLPALAVAASVAFAVLVQMGLLGNWLEVTRLTFLSWMLLAVVEKELYGREGRRS